MKPVFRGKPEPQFWLYVKNFDAVFKKIYCLLFMLSKYLVYCFEFFSWRLISNFYSGIFLGNTVTHYLVLVACKKFLFKKKFISDFIRKEWTNKSNFTLINISTWLYHYMDFIKRNKSRLLKELKSKVTKQNSSEKRGRF